MRKGLKGLPRLLAAFQNSINGLRDIWRLEEAFRLEAIVLFFAIPAAFIISESLYQASILVSVVLLVIIIEVLNSAIEATIDRISVEHHELSRIAKDLGSLAVLLSAFLAVVVWAAALYESLKT